MVTKEINYYSIEYRMSKAKPVVILYGRDKDRNRVIIEDDSFFPFFYIDKDTVIDKYDSDITRKVKNFEGGYKNINDDEVIKVCFNVPYDTYALRNKFQLTYNSNIRFTTNYLVNKKLFYGVRQFEGDILPMDAIPNIEPRRVYLDIECVMEEGIANVDKADGVICNICLYDSYSKHYYSLFYHPTFAIKNNIHNENNWTILTFSDECSLLEYFISMIKDIDPDYLMGWNSEGYDLPMIINRCKRLGINYTFLSTSHGVNVEKPEERNKADSIIRDRSDLKLEYDVKIRGRQVVDLMVLYKVLHRNEGISRFTLDEIGERVVGKKKNVLPDTYYNTWMKHPLDMIKYNKQDVKLCVDIDEEDGISNKFEDLRKVIGLDMETAYQSNMEIGKSLLLRETDKAIPVIKRKEAMGSIEVCVTNPAGKIIDNIINFDLNQLYPSIIRTFNISPETMSDDGDIEIDEWKFRSHPLGILPKTIESLQNRRKEVQVLSKKTMAMYGITDKRFKNLDNQQKWLKSIINAVSYGVASILFDAKLARAIPFIGNLISTKTMEKIEELSYAHVYGDTDSTFVKGRGNKVGELVLNGREIEEKLNEYYPDLLSKFGVKDSHIKIEMKEIYSRVFFKAKRRYISTIIWKDGKILDKPELTITGEERGNYSQLSKEVAERIYDMFLVENKDANTVRKVVRNVVEAIKNGKIPLSMYAIPTSMTKKKEEYTGSAKNHPRIRAREYSNKYFGTNYGIGNVSVAHVKSFDENSERYPSTDVIAFDYIENVPKSFWDTHEVDYNEMVDKSVRARIEDIFNAHQMRWKDVTSDDVQTKFNEFFKI